jgi:hypothetical protein
MATNKATTGRDPDIKGMAPGAARKPGVTRFDTSVMGQTGLRQSSGYVDEELLAELRGQRGRRVYKEMSDNCPVVGSLLFALQALFRSVAYTVQPADETPEAEDAAKFVEEVFDDMERPVESLMTEISTMFIYGFSLHEMLWKKRVGPDEADPTRHSRFNDNKIGLRGLPGRAQATIVRWDIDDASGRILGAWQQPYTGVQLYIPMEKMVLFRTSDAMNNPEGRSILRNAYRPWYFKRRIEEIEAVGVERDMAGLPLARIPVEYMDADADPAEKAVFAAYQALVKGVRRDTNEGLVLPSETDAQGKYRFDFTLLSTGGSARTDTTKVLERYDRQIAMSALADFIFLGQSAVGSFALSSDKTALFGQALGAFLKMTVAELNRTVLPALWAVNGMDQTTMPKFHVEDVERPDLTMLAGFITSLAGAGAPMFPDRELENKLREMANLPQAPEEGSEDFNLRGGGMPGMTLGPDGKPLPSTAWQQQQEQQKAAAAAAASPERGAGMSVPQTDSDMNGIADWGE